MRWYARPEGDKLQLRIAPAVDSWNRADDVGQVRLQAFLEDTAALLDAPRVDGPLALRLDVGLSAEKNLLHENDLDNYLKPLVNRLKLPDLVSVWGTKQHSEHSFVRIEPACAVPPPSIELRVARPTVSYEKTLEYRAQIHAALVDATELPASQPVRLELAFVVGSAWNWLNLWKPTIDALDPILGLGPTRPGRAWNPLDGRIKELGMHVTVDPAARHITIGIAASCM